MEFDTGRFEELTKSLAATLAIDALVRDELDPSDDAVFSGLGEVFSDGTLSGDPVLALASNRAWSRVENELHRSMREELGIEDESQDSSPDILARRFLGSVGLIEPELIDASN